MYEGLLADMNASEVIAAARAAGFDGQIAVRVNDIRVDGYLSIQLVVDPPFAGEQIVWWTEWRGVGGYTARAVCRSDNSLIQGGNIKEYRLLLVSHNGRKITGINEYKW